MSEIKTVGLAFMAKCNNLKKMGFRGLTVGCTMITCALCSVSVYAQNRDAAGTAVHKPQQRRRACTLDQQMVMFSLA